MRGVIASVIAALLVAGAAYAVWLTLNSEDVARIGGTGLVQVLSPTTNGNVNEVLWQTDTNTGYVTGVDVNWTPAETGTYLVHVNVYDGNQNMLTSGTTTETIQAADVGADRVTSVPLAQSVDPSQLVYVEVIITQTTTS